jgi:hypothetical protein
MRFQLANFRLTSFRSRFSRGTSLDLIANCKRSRRSRQDDNVKKGTMEADGERATRRRGISQAVTSSQAKTFDQCSEAGRRSEWIEQRP